MSTTLPFDGTIEASFWDGKRIFLTGHTGFKGSWLSLWLHELGAKVFGYALEPEHAGDAYLSAEIGSFVDSEIADVRNRDRLKSAVMRAAPDIVFHLAAQPLVRQSYAEPVETFDVNVMGTVNLLEACRAVTSIRATVIVTTDKVYENADDGEMFVETDALGGAEPYGYSKAAAEMATAAWRGAFLAAADNRVATARAGNVIGGGDWNRDRLVPDAMRAFASGETLLIRSPNSIRPWQHVVEPLKGYLLLAQALCQDAAAARGWNFGPAEDQCLAVREVADLLAASWGDGAAWQPSGDANGPHEATKLLLDSGMAMEQLGWQPSLDIKAAVANTTDWYRVYHDNADADALQALMRRQIRAATAAVPLRHDGRS